MLLDSPDNTPDLWGVAHTSRLPESDVARRGHKVSSRGTCDLVVNAATGILRVTVES